MTDLMLQENSQPLTMSSREIARLVESRHPDVVRAIERLMEKGAIGGYTPTAYTHEQNGQRYTEYLIGKRDSYVVVAQLSPAFTAKLVDRWQELEEQAAGALPDFADPVASARAWADAKEAERAAISQAEQLRDETRRLNAVCNDLAENLKAGLTPVEFCRMLNGVNLNRVQPLLVERKRLLKTMHGYRSAAAYRDKLFTERRYLNRDERPCEKVVLTQKGAKWLYSQYEQGQLDMRKDWDGKFTHVLFDGEDKAA